jgi:hypothetical protein
MSPTWAEPFREDWEMRTSQIRISNPPILSPHGEEIFWMAQEWDRGKRENRANGVADLARVDGAILANVTPDVLAFGVVCNNFETLRQTQATTARLRLMRLTDPSRPFEGGTEAMPEEFGGSRHQSAIDFCSNLAPAAAIVASHDGGITVFVSGEPGEVRGMRISGISSTNRVPPSADPPIA